MLQAKVSAGRVSRVTSADSPSTAVRASPRSKVAKRDSSAAHAHDFGEGDSLCARLPMVFTLIKPFINQQD